MRLNHLNLTVTHVLEAHQFLEKYFRLQSMGAGNDKMAGLLDDNGFTLVLMRESKGSDLTYPNTFHIGFTQESREQVNEIYQRLRNDGFDVPAPRDIHGGWAFYFQAPGGFIIEVSC